MKFLIVLLFPIFLLAERADCTAFFSKEDQLAEKLIECIKEERVSIKVAIYSMTHHQIAKALIDAKNRGVQVEVLVDSFSLRSTALLQKLSEAKIPIYVWKPHVQNALMHDKFVVFGSNKVWTGSFNFTYSASKKHQENAVLIESREIAQKYLLQFSKMTLYESLPYQKFLTTSVKKKREKKSKLRV